MLSAMSLTQSKSYENVLDIVLSFDCGAKKNGFSFQIV